ncbi:hypothetical protein FA95DRAFT_1509498, partial [Auriscalpium vulgare]
MPRLIARLYESLTAGPSSSDTFVRRVRPPAKRPKSLFKPAPPTPDWSLTDRRHSVLLDSVNPIIRPREYVHHKTLPPRVRVSRTQRKKTTSRDGSVEHDQPRSMTVAEREWEANPYLRMLSSPLRRCAVTSRYLPRDFMVRLTPKLLAAPRGTSKRQTFALLPDGLEHSKFNNLQSRKGSYVICREAAFAELQKKPGRLSRIMPGLIMSPSLSQYIHRLLQVRILQELEILADQLQTRPQNAEDAPLLRRLTRAELSSLRTDNILPSGDVIAVIIVPPLNKDPNTKQRPVPSVSSLPEPGGVTVKRAALPVSVLYPDQGGTLPSVVSSARVPLYNGVSLFQSRALRSALHERLCRLLLVERRARYRKQGRAELSHAEFGNKLEHRKGSHAFVLYSGAKTVKRADSAALAIALWRLRLWNGNSWE